MEASRLLLVTGDACVDRPSSGAAVIGRVLEAEGYRVGVVAQPSWRSPAGVARLGAGRGSSPASPPEPLVEKALRRIGRLGPGERLGGSTRRARTRRLRPGGPEAGR